MNRYLLFVSIFLIISNIARAQDSFSLDAIPIHHSDEGSYIFHVFAPGETLYSISKYYGCDLNELTSLNGNIDPLEIELGHVLKVPIHSITQSNANDHSVPLVYQVKPKETLFTIGKKYFGVSMKKLKQMNNLKSNSLSIGQDLIVGYLSNGASPQSIPTHITQNKDVMQQDIDEDLTVEENTSSENSTLDSPTIRPMDEGKTETSTDELLDIIDMIYDTISTVNESSTDPEILIEEEEIMIILENGLAYTEVVDISNESLFVLHPKAKVNSKMELIYPMLNTRIIATVISELPRDLYPENISVVISPGVAKALGAKDNQFKVQMKFVEE